jgi:hypothetical protein
MNSKPEKATVHIGNDRDDEILELTLDQLSCVAGGITSHSVGGGS